MKEVEIKAWLRNKKEVMDKLGALGCLFAAPITQEDVVYAERVATFEEFRANEVFLRLRVKDGKKVLFTLKKRLKNDLDALEYEVEVSSKLEMEQMLFLMGYKEAARVNKTRITTSYNDCTICIDEVEGLGTFIEMEKLCKEGDSEEIQKELFTFFMTLGIEEKDRVHSGYDVLMMQK